MAKNKRALIFKPDSPFNYAFMSTRDSPISEIGQGRMEMRLSPPFSSSLFLSMFYTMSDFTTRSGLD